MQLALTPVLQHVIGPSQLGFQQGKYIGEATALAQLVSAFCTRHNRPGLLLLHDGELAYDLVSWSWLQECLHHMGFPPSFRTLVRMLFTDISSKVKVNGHVGDAFEIANSVEQGCPLAPYLYIISRS